MLLEENMVPNSFYSPKTEKENAKKYGQDAHADGLGFLKHFYNAVHECGHP